MALKMKPKLRNGDGLKKDEAILQNRKSFPQRNSHFVNPLTGCRMPGGVDSPQAFWDVLVNQKDMVSEVPSDRWSLDSFHDPDQTNHSKMVTRRGGFIHNMDKFDNTFFKISPREASSMDPQQRHILEVTYEAFQDAGVLPSDLKESCGVYIGVGMMDYAVMLTETSLIGPYMHTGTAHSSVANRISYVFDLRGPSFAVETACASSMTAMHLACDAIWNGECTYAVSGGCNALLIPETTVGFSALGVLSAEGKCCPFSDKGNGYVRSEGFGAFILKPLEAAMAENDHIYAVIRGSSIAANGSCKSLTMPSGPAQEMVMRSAYKRFGIPTSLVQYVEAHGTGTPVGDPIEAEAIGSIFGTQDNDPIKIGSVKSNFGHNECAAGITSSIKVALMLDKKTLAPTINHDKPNPNIDLKGLNLQVQTTTESLKGKEGPYTIGLNSFGFSGAVAHMIFQEAPQPLQKTQTIPNANWKFGDGDQLGRPVILPLSAKSKDALNDLAQRWLEFESDKDALSVVSWQATRRDHHPYRLAVIANSGASCRQSLEGFLQGGISETVISGTAPQGKPKICFVFPGQGQQWVDMGRKLYRADNVFKESIDRCDSIYRKISGWSLLEKCGLFNGNAIDSKNSPYSSVDDALNQVEVVQPAITFIQVSLFHLWKHLGVHPDVVVGHSVGEIAAAYACGGLTLEEAISVIYHRSHEQAKQKGTGTMAALRATKEQAERICEEHEHLYIAAVNAPGSMTLAGNIDVIAAVVENNPGKAKQLRVTCAFHTPEMDPIKKPFMAAMKGVVTSETGKRDVPYYSTVTGKDYEGSFDTDYWWNNIRSAVLFQPAIEAILQETKADIFLEIAASNTLLTPIKQIAHALDPKNPPVIINSSLREKDDLLNMQRAVGSLYTNGTSLDWRTITDNAAEWAPVPTYPWQHQSFWLETDERQKHRLGLDDRTIKGQSGKFTLDMFPFLADHVVGNRIVFPGAGYVEFMIQMGFPEMEKPALKNINFTRVLPWPEDADPKKCTLKLAMVKDGTKMQVTCDGNQHSDAHMESVPSKTLEAPFPLEEIQKRCTVEVSSELFYSRLAAVGLKYGPAFQTVEKMFLGDGEALAILNLVTDNKQRIQITHFDATFQLVLSAVGPFNAMYLPIRIDSMQMTTEAIPSGKKILAYTKIHEYDSTYIGADIKMLTLDGQVLVDVKGFLAQNFSGNQSDVPIESCVYSTLWQPASACTLPTSVLSEVFQKENLQEMWGDDLDVIMRAEKVLDDLEGVCVSYIKHALDEVPSEEMNAKIVSYIRRIKSLQINTKTKPIPYSHIPAVIRNILNTAPELDAEVNLLKHFGDILPESLKDPQVGLSVLYPEEGIDNYYHNSLSTRLYYKATSQAVVKSISEAVKQKTVVRVLELGGQIGSLTQMVLEPLKDMGLTEQIEYVFTDGNKKLIQQAQDNLSDYSFIEYKQLDIKKNAKEQDLVANSFDIVICVNALHATNNIQQSARNVRNLVSPDGLMFIIENTKMHFLADFFSLAAEEEHHLLSRKDWVDTMISVGLQDIVSASSPQEFFHSVFAGRKPPVSPQMKKVDNKLIIIQNESDQFTVKFLKSYKGKSEMCKFSTAEPFDCIISEQIESPAEVMYVYSDEDSNLYTLLRLFQAVETYPEAVKRVWVLTTGGNSDSPCPSGSLAVGLARAVSNQIPTVQIVTVDFDPCSKVEENVQELLKLMNDDATGEQEIIIRNGERRVPRLIRQDLQEVSKVQSKNWRVEQDLKGPRGKGASIDDLAFHDVPDLEIPPGHVKIAVQAAPLNFKDVMMALGLLEGLESDVHPSFGLECAGVVVEVGSGVSDLDVNDKVMAFGKNCFASHAVCDSRLTVPKPENLSWLDSSSVGVIFVTAYLSLVDRANLKKGETVLIHSACGGVGLAAIQIARMRGAKIICTAGTEEKRSYLRQELGMDLVSDSRSTRFYDDVMEWTDGKGVDVVLNSLSGKLLQTGLSLLSPGGRFCEIGKRDILQGSSLPMSFFLENKVFHSCQLDILMKQRPEEVQTVMKKVVSLFEDSTLQPIPTSVYSIENLKDTFRVMSKGSHIGKIVFEVPENFQPKEVHPSLCQFKPNATYIVTGGYGGIGQALSRWLCLNGAKHIALVSRRGATTAAAKRTLNFLKKNNVHTYEFYLDISNKTSVEELLMTLQQNKMAPPIKGIFHLAGVIDEENLHDITPSQIDRILGAKALGAQHLNELTQNNNLDIFFMLSSISTTWGHQAQPCYCAANAYLDALAEKRHSEGLPALSVQLAPVRGAGYLEDKGQTVKVLAMKGCYQLHVDEFLQVVGQLLPRRDLPVVTFANQDWGITQTTCHRSLLKFHHLATRSKATATKGETPHMELADMETSIKSKMGELLCMSEEAIDISQPMVNYGVDSLVALEIANWATNQLGVEISQLDILGGMATVELIEKAMEAN
ncbi:hybrid PKS-NRPS synthetase pynA-like [Patiria miniata]|uniref:Carrier domain-containing protein n=1 Tax=Patiria miniata TaxID=46514 RepID=A0A914BJU9_PATMI|nr:hybrid PKS-NRPS synthetase pynA-like [Patiria miniata]